MLMVASLIRNNDQNSSIQNKQESVTVDWTLQSPDEDKSGTYQADEETKILPLETMVNNSRIVDNCQDGKRC